MTTKVFSVRPIWIDVSLSAKRRRIHIVRIDSAADGFSIFNLACSVIHYTHVETNVENAFCHLRFLLGRVLCQFYGVMC